jgi:nucleoside 2-deoxyribosyltransferase
MIYLASPYHSDAAIREQRFRAACRAAAALLREGKTVVSPIAHSHPLVEHGLPTTWEFWRRYNVEYLQRCDALIVLTLDGWQESVGVQAEIRIAGGLGKPISFSAPE